MEYNIDPQETVPQAVLYCVSVAENQPETALPPLFRAIDPDALDDIWQDFDGATQANEIRVSFQYSNSHITIENDQTVTVKNT